MALSGMSFRIRETVFTDLVSDAPDAVFRHRRMSQPTPLSSFELVWPIVQTAEMDAIVAEFDAAKGSAGTGTLTHPVLGAISVRFADEMLVERRAAGRWRVTVTVEVDY